MTESEFGEWLKQEMNNLFFFEKEGWAPERARRVAERLQLDRPESDRCGVIVYFGDRGWTFTAPGRYIFFCRRLLERCRDDVSCAFVIAHEIAHHDLGHLGQIPEWAKRFALSRGAWVVAALSRAIERRLYGPEMEGAADRHALDLCFRAGYDPRDAMDAFRSMRALLKDFGAQDAIYGPDFQLDTPQGPKEGLRQVRLWAWQRAQGYLSLDHRERELRKYLGSMLLPTKRMPSPTDLADLELPSFGEAPIRHVPWPGTRKPRPDEDVFVTLPSGMWLCRRAAHRTVAFFSPVDGGVRMLGRHRSPDHESLEVLAAEAADRVFRRWWRGPNDELHRLDLQGKHIAVISSLPQGTLRAEEHLEVVLLGSAVGGPDGLPFEGLGTATGEELNHLLRSSSVTADKSAT